MGRIIPYIMANKKWSKPPTRYTYIASLSLETRYLFWVNLLMFGLWVNWVKICLWSCANIVEFGGNLRFSWQSMGVLNMKNTLLLLVSHEPLHFLRMGVRAHDLPLESVEELNGPKAEFPVTVHRFPEKAALHCRIFSSTPQYHTLRQSLPRLEKDKFRQQASRLALVSTLLMSHPSLGGALSSPVLLVLEGCKALKNI